MVYPALLPLMLTPRLPFVDWTDAPADLNGLVHFAERRNLVSACVSSHFIRSLGTLHQHCTVRNPLTCKYSASYSVLVSPCVRPVWLLYVVFPLDQLKKTLNSDIVIGFQTIMAVASGNVLGWRFLKRRRFCWNKESWNLSSIIWCMSSICRIPNATGGTEVRILCRWVRVILLLYEWC